GEDFETHVVDLQQIGLEISYSSADLERLKEQFKDDPARWEHITRNLITVREKRYRELRPNEADGRICNELALMKKDVRHLLRCGELKYRAVLDIRACHATFWSGYVLSHIYNGGPADSVSAQESSSSSSTPHYVPHIGDTYSKTHSQTSEEKAIEQEHRRWVDLFCSERNDPREVIARQAGYGDQAKVKQALNETINGSKRYGKLGRWMKGRFPNLYEAWSKSDVKKTGPQISRLFETRLMLDEELYRSADGMGIKLAYEYDGLGIFAPENHEGLRTQLDDLVRQITTRAEELWGIPVVVKVEVLSSP
ncbi:MAG: hypothetical protein KJ072_20910, partial [Verrucomicrobia bacterium]|nr:hypothetical protein [Verrucomicrobiota bacterium]